VFKGHSRRQEREHDARAWLAWHTVRLSHVDPRKFPKLETLLYRHRARRRQTPDEMLSIAKMITAAFGGDVKLKKD